MARILAVSDVHGDQSGVLAIKELIINHQPDILAIASDITHFGPGEWAMSFLDSIDVPLVAINGNCDTEDVIQILNNHEAGLLNECREFIGLKILGLSYPFARDFLSDCEPEIILCHVPPKGCNDFVPGPGNIGDENLRGFILKHRPLLVLSGHVHECPGIVELDGIICINPGPAKDGRGAVIDINGDNIEARLVHSH